MQDDYNEDLTPAEREALSSLSRETEPPRGMEDRTVAALKNRGLIERRPSPWWRAVRYAAVATGFVVAFVLGTRFGGTAPTDPAGDGDRAPGLVAEGTPPGEMPTDTPPGTAAGAPDRTPTDAPADIPDDMVDVTQGLAGEKLQFMFLYVDPRNFIGITEEELNRRVGEYVSWYYELRDLGLEVSGHKLHHGVRVITAQDGWMEVSRNPEDISGQLGGYFAVRGMDIDAAAEIAKTCPHLKYGGTIEIRSAED